MASFKFKGLEYELPAREDFTNREMMEIERISGHEASAIFEMFEREGLSYRVFVAIAYISIRRSGASTDLDELLDARMTDFDLQEPTNGEEAAAQPLPLPDDAPTRGTDTGATPEAAGDQT